MGLSRPRLRRVGARRRCPALRPPPSSADAVTPLRPSDRQPPAPTALPVQTSSPLLPASSTTEAAVRTICSVAELGSSCSRCPSQVVLAEATMGLGMQQPGSWASIADEDSDSNKENLAPVTPVAMESSSVAAQPAQQSVCREAKASMGWQEVMRRRGSCR
jgi:hypothetical protein